MEEENKKKLPPPAPEDNFRQKSKEESKMFWHEGVPYAPPSAIDFEETVIGALLIDKKSQEEVCPYLLPEVFFVLKNRRIYSAILDMYQKSNPIDLLTVCDQLRRKGYLKLVGGESYLIELTQKISSGAHIDFHSRILIQKYILRELIQNSTNTITQSYKDDPDSIKLLDNTEIELSRIKEVALRKTSVNELSEEDELRERVEKERSGEIVGFPIGVFDFDDWSGGLQLRELICFASRPGMGKTSVMLSMSKNLVTNKNIPVQIFSLEMAKADINYRIAASLTLIPFSRIRKGKLTDEEFNKVVEAIRWIKNDSLFNIYDTKDCKNVLEVIIQMIRKDVRDKGVKIVYIDYVQLMNLAVGTGNDTQDLKRITRALKQIANELNILVIMFSQLGREVDKRKGHRPSLGDLKQSGSIEEDSDMVYFFLREAYYREQELKPGDPPLPAEFAGQIELIGGKGRSTGVKNFMANLEFSSYTLS